MAILNKYKLQCFLNSFPGLVGLFAYVAGLIWFILLSQDEFNHQTYISENALLVGQVAEKFMDDSRLRQMEAEASSLYANGDIVLLRRWLTKQLEAVGLEVYEQNFTFAHPVLYPVREVSGTNVYAIMRSPSGGRTEALLLTVPLRTECSNATSPCLSASLSLVISLMNLLRGQIYWAKDIVAVFPDSDYVGLLAWLESYHGSSISTYLSWTELKGRSGAIQAGLNLEFTQLDVDFLSISSEGVNGLLANLDLVNTVVRLGQKHSIEPVVNGQVFEFQPDGDFEYRKANALGLLHAVWTQASGSPTGLHGLLVKYQIPAVTLRGPVLNFQKYTRSNSAISLSRLVEGTLRSLNNLQERMHQSFWNYLLPNPMRYVSIGVYMPPVLILIGSILVKVIGFWWVPEENTSSHGCSIQAAEQRSAVQNLSDDQKQMILSKSSDQVVRKRISLSKASKVLGEDMLVALKDPINASDQGLPPSLSCLAIWIVVSFASGLGFCYFPAIILHAYQHPARVTVEELLGVQPFISEFLAFCLVLVFAIFMILLPNLVLLLQRLFVGRPDVPRCWSSSIILTSWTLFLACTSLLNVSASLLMGLVVAPCLLLFVRQTRMPKWMSCMFGLSWFLVSPPVLSALACSPQLVDLGQYNKTVSYSASLLSDLWTRVSQMITQLVIEADLLGSWTWPALTAGFSSLWLLTWTNACCAG